VPRGGQTPTRAPQAAALPAAVGPQLLGLRHCGSAFGRVLIKAPGLAQAQRPHWLSPRQEAARGLQPLPMLWVGHRCGRAGFEGDTPLTWPLYGFIILLCSLAKALHYTLLDSRLELAFRRHAQSPTSVAQPHPPSTRLRSPFLLLQPFMPTCVLVVTICIAPFAVRVAVTICITASLRLPASSHDPEDAVMWLAGFLPWHASR